MESKDKVFKDLLNEFEAKLEYSIDEKDYSSNMAMLEKIEYYKQRWENAE